MRVKIKIRSQLLRVEIDANSETNTLLYDGEIVECDVVGFVDKAIDIMKDWTEKMIDFSILDGVEYRVTFDDGSGDIRNANGFGKTPENFEDLVKLIRKIKPTLEMEIYKMSIENIDLNKKSKGVFNDA